MVLVSAVSLKGEIPGLDSGDAKKLKQLEDENRKLKHVVAELTLDNRALKNLLSKTGRACEPKGGGNVRGRAVRHERTPCLRAGGDRAVEQTIPEGRPTVRDRLARAVTEAGTGAAAVRLSAADGDAIA